METSEILTSMWLETVERFEEEATPFLSKYLLESEIEFLSVKELIQITEEDVGEFLSRDPESGYYFPEKWAKEVFQNFLSNQNYYWDKLVRNKDGQKST